MADVLARKKLALKKISRRGANVGYLCVGLTLPRVVLFICDMQQLEWYDVAFCVIGMTALIVSEMADDELAKIL